MSERNGDKARFHRERRKYALKRKLNRESLRSNAVKAAPSEAGPKPRN